MELSFVPPGVPPCIGDKFGESLGGSEATPSFWEVPRTSPEVSRTSPEVFGDFPGSSLTVELNSNPEVPQKFPKLPRKFPKLPWKFPGLPRRSAVSLGSLAPSSDSQKLSLTVSPYPLKFWGVADSPPKFSGRSVRNPLFYSVFRRVAPTI